MAEKNFLCPECKARLNGQAESELVDALQSHYAAAHHRLLSDQDARQALMRGADEDAPPANTDGQQRDAGSSKGGEEGTQGETARDRGAQGRNRGGQNRQGQGSGQQGQSSSR